MVARSTTRLVLASVAPSSLSSIRLKGRTNLCDEMRKHEMEKNGRVRGWKAERESGGQTEEGAMAMPWESHEE